MPFQFDGQPALGADLFFACVFSTPPKNVLQLEREQRMPACVLVELGSFCGVARDGEFRAGNVQTYKGRHGLELQGRQG